MSDFWRHQLLAVTALAALLASSTAVAWTPCGFDCDQRQTAPTTVEGHECCPPADPDPSAAIRTSSPDCCGLGCVLAAAPAVFDDELASPPRAHDTPAPIAIAQLPVVPARALARPMGRPAPPPQPTPTRTTRLLI